MSAAVAVEDLRIRAGELELVRGVSFSLARGDALTILGESGSGKSLMAQAIMGVLPSELSAAGSVIVNGSASAAASAERAKLWGRSIALLPQEPWLALDPTMRVIGQVAEGYLNVNRKTARNRAMQALESLGIGNAVLKYPFMLSGGMAQRVSFAATRAGDASVLIVDEPTKGLDAELRSQLVEMLLAARHEGRTLITVTHDIAVARAIGGSIAVMLEGQIVEYGSTKDVIGCPRHDYTKRLIAAQPSEWFPFSEPPSSSEILLSGSSLSKTFSGRTLFTDVDIDIQIGSRIAISGASGSGKTTLGNMLLGLVRPDKGQVTRKPGLNPLRFQKLYQDPPSAFVPDLMIRSSLGDLVRRHHLDTSAIEPLMQQLGLADLLLNRRPNQISGGELQRFALLRLLLLDPALIFADEPTSRLDPITQRETMSLLVARATERQCALLLVTHDPDIARKVAGSTIHSMEAM